MQRITSRCYKYAACSKPRTNVTVIIYRYLVKGAK